MAKYFKDVNTLEALRKQYKDLLKKFHPDNTNGSTEITQEINAEYDKLFKLLKDRHESQTEDSDDKKAWYYHTEAFIKKSHKSLTMDDIRNYYVSA